MRLLNEIQLDYDNVLIRPHRSNLVSRKEVKLTRKMKFKHSQAEWTGIPIMAANMDTTGTFEISNVFEENTMFTCLHKHYDLEELYAHFFEPRQYSSYSMGITDADVHKWEKLKGRLPKGNIKYVCIDVANGYTERFIEFVKKFREENPEITIIAGNVVTADITEELILAGADMVKVGIGPGSVCTTRLKTGVGYPQLSAVIECADAAHGLDGHIVADGGCKNPGDVAKAFAAGADFVMLGGMLAGHEESGGETTVKDGKMYKYFYGMSSEKANHTYSGGMQDYKASEGREVLIPFKGSVSETIQEILGGLRSTCTYVGASQLKHLTKRTTFIRCMSTHNNIFE